MDLVTDVTFIRRLRRTQYSKGGPDNPLGAAAGEDVGLHHRFVGRARVKAPTDGSVFALGVLPEDDQVYLAGGLAGQRRGDAGVEVGRPDTNTLVVGPAHGQQQALQGDVVGNVRVAHGAEQDGLVGRHLLQPVLGHHPPVSR